MENEEKKVVVVDASKQQLILGILIPGTGSILGLGGSELSTEPVVVVRKDDSTINDNTPISKEIMSQYPEILVVGAASVFDRADFYMGNIPPEKYIATDYARGDYIAGIANPECPTCGGLETTIRLVGGVIEDIEIFRELKGASYTYRVRYKLNVDVSYSVEQLRCDGMRPDTYYALDTRSRRYYTWVDERHVINIVSMTSLPKKLREGDQQLPVYECAERLSGSHKYTLFYIMAVLLIKAQMCALRPTNIRKIADALLKSSWNAIYRRPMDSTDAQLMNFESPLKSVLSGIVALISTLLDSTNNPGIFKATSSAISELFTKGVILCPDVGQIPWDAIIDDVPLSSLTDPDICGIDQHKFTELVIAYINSCAEGEDSHRSRRNIDIVASHIYGSSTPSIIVGAYVKIDREGFNHWSETPDVDADKIKTVKVYIDKDSVLVVVEERPETGEVGVRNVLTPTAPAVYIPTRMCIAYCDDTLKKMDSYIFTQS